jgi:hypothetical protein
MAHDQEIVSSNPGTVYWMDVSDASYYIKEKIENKDSQMGHTKIYLKKQDLLGQVSRMRKREGQKYVNFYGKS